MVVQDLEYEMEFLAAELELGRDLQFIGERKGGDELTWQQDH